VSGAKARLGCLVIGNTGRWRGFYAGDVTGGVKIVQFSYSNEDTKDEEGREGCRPEMI
jgi:hypothetical protein